MDLFLPTRIAFACNSARAKEIRLINCLFVIPFNWHLALLWATSPEKTVNSHGEQAPGPAVSKTVIGQLPATDKSAFSKELRDKQELICDKARNLQLQFAGTGNHKAQRLIEEALTGHPRGTERLRRLSKVLQQLFFDFDWSEEISDAMRCLADEIQHYTESGQEAQIDQE